MCNSEFVQSMQRRNRCIVMFIEMRLVWLWVMLLVLAGECYGCLEHERVALLQLKASSINHQIKYIPPTWVKAWESETTTDCCKWERVKCNTTTGRVIQLSLNSVENHWKLRDWYLNASMFLPFEELESLDLSYNGFAGWLENGGYEKLGELTSLKSLNLSANSLKGTIHINDLKDMNNLEQLDISQNSFDGFITHSGFDRLSVLGKLKLLDLSGNSFNNGIVPSLGFLSSLQTLSLGGNKLNGLVDIGEFCNMNNLKELDLRANSIEDIKGFEQLSALGKLELLRLDWNSFNNSILQSLGVLSSLKTLSLSTNRLNESIDIGALPQPAKGFRQSTFPSKGLKKLLRLPLEQRKAPLLLNFIATYRSTLPDVPRQRASASLPSSSRPDQASTSGPAEVTSTSTPQQVPASRRHCRRPHPRQPAEVMGRKTVVEDLLGDLPEVGSAMPTPSDAQPKPRRTKRAKAKPSATEVETEDSLPIARLAEVEAAVPSKGKRPAEGKASNAPKSKRPRSSSSAGQGSFRATDRWAPEILAGKRPVTAGDSAIDDIEVVVGLSAAVLLPADLNRMAEVNEYENYAMMMQHSILAIQHAHSFASKAEEMRDVLAKKTKEASSHLASLNKAESKIKKLLDAVSSAEAAQADAVEKEGEAKAIAEVYKSQAREADAKTVEAQAELQAALATKKAEIDAADEKAFSEGQAAVRDAYKLQVNKGVKRGFQLGWTAALDKLGVAADSPLRDLSQVPVPFPPTPAVPADQAEDDESEAEEEVAASGAQSSAPPKQVLDLTQDEDEVPRTASPVKSTAEAEIEAEKAIQETIQELDAEIQAEADVVEATQPGVQSTEHST